MGFGAFLESPLPESLVVKTQLRAQLEVVEKQSVRGYGALSTIAKTKTEQFLNNPPWVIEDSP
jgi:hypothetical protein